MTLIKKQIEVEAKIGDKIKAPGSIFREDIDLFICYIQDDLLFISDDENSYR